MVTAFKQTANNAAGYLKYAMTISQTTLTLETGQGQYFPAVGPFWVTLFGADPADACEIILAGGRTGDQLTTLTRAQQGTSAAVWDIGSAVQLLITAAHMTEIHAAVNALETGIDFAQTVADMTTYEPTKTGIITISGVQYRIALDPV